MQYPLYGMTGLNWVFWFPSGIIDDFNFLDMPPIEGEKLSNQRMVSGIVARKILLEDKPN